MLFSTSRNILNRIALPAVALAASVAVAYAQTPNQDHAAHHPTGETTEAPSGPAGTGMPGMPTGQPGGMPMMGGNMGEMMGMMQMMRAMMAQGGMLGSMGMMPLDHIEGRIAFLKAELGITAEQEPQWSAFADALRAQAKTMQSARATMMGQRGSATWPDRLARHEQALSERLAALKAIEGPVKSLYAVLSEQQQHRADELMKSPMMGTI